MMLYIISDVHLGSRHCRLELFERFLGRMPPQATLVLNGDVVDHMKRPLPESHREVLGCLVEESRRRRVVWVGGNHDETFRPAGGERIEFVPALTIPGRLHVVHGYYLHRYVPGYEPFVMLVRALHRMRILFGAEPVHVAQYVKRWTTLYGVLRRYVRESALREARLLGVGTVVCGHVHYAEDTTVEGVRYVNTGSWTESPCWCFRMDGECAALCRVKPDGDIES